MICPNCKAEYREGFYVCADCNVSLVGELPPFETPKLAIPTDKINFEKVFETLDSYEFLDASNILKNAGIPFTGDEFYNGEIRTGKREQAPYIWSLLVPAGKREEALQLLGEKISGPPIMVSQEEEEPMKPTLAWMILVVIAVIAFLMVILIWKGYRG